MHNMLKMKEKEKCIINVVMPFAYDIPATHVVKIAIHIKMVLLKGNIKILQCGQYRYTPAQKVDPDGHEIGNFDRIGLIYLYIFFPICFEKF